MQEKTITFKFDAGFQSTYGKLADGTVFACGGCVYVKINKKVGARDLERPGMCWWPGNETIVYLRNF